MSKTIRFVNDCIEDLVFFNGEDTGHYFHHFKDNAPYPLRYGEFHSRVLHIPEDSINGFITGEPYGQRNQIVLQGRDRGCGKLRSEVPGLALAYTQQPFGFLEEYLEGPAHGIDPTSFQELQVEVGRHYCIPGFFFSLHEIEPYICARKANVSSNIYNHFISIIGKPRFEHLIAHAEVVLLTLLPEDGEVEYKLTLAISDACGHFSCEPCSISEW